MGKFDGRRLSWLRLGVLIGGVAALVFTGLSGWRWFEDSQAASGDKSWFAAYVDVTTTPQLAFEEPVSTAARDVVLSFIVATPSKPCEPSWGTYYSIDDAALDLDLDRRIARLRQNDGDVVVSFGGASNDELANVCTDDEKLLAAYSSVVDHYDLRTIDLDLEGAGLNDAAAIARRAAVIAKLQDARDAKKKDLRVWLTLPVEPKGLSAQGSAAVRAMLDAGVEISGINVMTMDFGSSRAKGQSMIDASIDSLESAHRQLGQIYKASGDPIGPATLWKRMGATPMIGQNDIAGEVFGLDAARELNRFAKSKGLGRISMWSLNRDRTCGANYPDVSVVSNSCSGIDQGDETFAQLLRRGMTDRPGTASVAPTESERPEAIETADDPKTSPYPIWTEDETYVSGSRVVWHHNVYVSKWWTTGNLPDDPTVDEFSSPWQLVGPVLAGETPIPPVKLPKGTYPDWDGEQVYTKGERVLFEGVAFSAKWWTQGDNPGERSTQSDPSPWQQLTDSELRDAALKAE